MMRGEAECSSSLSGVCMSALVAVQVVVGLGEIVFVTRGKRRTGVRMKGLICMDLRLCFFDANRLS